MNHLHKNYLHRLQEIGVRTDKKIEVMYCDLFRVTENIFLRECHEHEAFELYDLIREERFQYLHELRNQMEELLLWMYPNGLSGWTLSTNNRFKNLSNPYLSANLEPLKKESCNTISSQEISAAFNIRYGKTGTQFRRDRELLLKMLQDRHFSTTAIEEYLEIGMDNIKIPLIGLDLMKQEIYILGPEETFISEVVEENSYSNAWYASYMKIFQKFSDTGLTAFYNERVERDNSAPAWQGILVALKEQLLNRQIDINSIESGNPLVMKQCVVLVSKKMHTIKELPVEIAKGLAMMYLKNGRFKSNYMPIKLTSVDEENINFLENGNLGYVQANAAIRSFYNQLLESSENQKKN
jgi:hypothetical protein